MGAGAEALPPAVLDFLRWADETSWVTDVLLSGSLATGDHRPATSDIDLVAVTAGPVHDERHAALVAMHRRVDATTGRDARLGCVYVPDELFDDVGRAHPTWTHGRLVPRPLSLMGRAELAAHGRSLHGRPVHALVAPADDATVRAAVRAELTGYWTWAARRPWLFLDARLADFALLTMARARRALRTGELVTKSRAANDIRAPRRVVDGIRIRREAGSRRHISPRTTVHAWLDVRRTIDESRETAPREAAPRDG